MNVVYCKVSEVLNVSLYSCIKCRTGNNLRKYLISIRKHFPEKKTPERESCKWKSWILFCVLSFGQRSGKWATKKRGLITFQLVLSIFRINLSLMQLFLIVYSIRRAPKEWEIDHIFFYFIFEFILLQA